MIVEMLFAAALSDAPLDDAALEARAQILMREIRCVSCENEPISQSASEIAGDMRHLVRSQIKSGASDNDVREWFAERYGDFVLFRPKSGGGGAFFMGISICSFIVGAGTIVLAIRARKKRKSKSLTPEQSDRSRKRYLA